MKNTEDMEDVHLCCLCQTDCQVVRNSNGGCSWGSIEKRNIFSYAGWGLFEVIGSDIPFEKGDICNICLGKYTCKEYKDVKCGVCHQIFQNMWGIGRDGGHGCDATISKTHISCGYGSCYDGDYMEFINGKPDYLDAGSEICNICLGELLKKKGICKHIEPPTFEISDSDREIDEEREKELLSGGLDQDFINELKDLYNKKDNDEDNYEDKEPPITYIDQNGCYRYEHSYPWKHIFDTHTIKHAKNKS